MATLGQSPVEVPRLGLGAMTWGAPTSLMARLHPAKSAYGGADSAAAEAEAFEASLARGVTLVDVAATYSLGAAEIRIGELSRGRDVVIASKFPMRFVGFRAQEFPDELQGSLRRLGRPVIDLYQHHHPGGTDIERLMELMADAVEAGKVRAVGVSNYSAAQMRRAHATLAKRGVPLAANQVQYSLLYRRPERDGVLAACRELGVTLIAYSPLAAGMLSGKYGAGQRAQGLRRFMPLFSRRGRAQVRPVVDLCRAIGERYGRTPGQVALRWLMDNPAVLPIPGAKNARQAEENAGALDFALGEEEVAQLAAASAGVSR